MLFVVVSAGAFTLAKLHSVGPAERQVGPVTLGDAAAARPCTRGVRRLPRTEDAEGGIGPRLAGAQLSLAAARAQIDNGGGIMPGRLVSGAARGGRARLPRDDRRALRGNSA